VTKQPVDSSKWAFEIECEDSGRPGQWFSSRKPVAWKVEDESWAVPLPKPVGGSWCRLPR